jgi:hypothetical protein
MKNNFGTYLPQDINLYGPSRGIILGRIKSWCHYNKKKKQHLHDGEYWSGHITQQEFVEQTGLDIQTIKRGLKWLLDNGIIEKGNFNKLGFDRTGWYRPTYQNDTMVVSKCTNVRYQNDTMESIRLVPTIPDSPFKSIDSPLHDSPYKSFEYISTFKFDLLNEEERNQYLKNKFNHEKQL